MKIINVFFEAFPKALYNLQKSQVGLGDVKNDNKGTSFLLELAKAGV